MPVHEAILPRSPLSNVILPAIPGHQHLLDVEGRLTCGCEWPVSPADPHPPIDPLAIPNLWGDTESYIWGIPEWADTTVYRREYMGIPRTPWNPVAQPVQLSLFELSPPIRPTRAPRRTSATEQSIPPTSRQNGANTNHSRSGLETARANRTPRTPGRGRRWAVNSPAIPLGSAPTPSTPADRALDSRQTEVSQGPGHAYAVGCPCEPCYRRGREITRRWAAETLPQHRFIEARVPITRELIERSIYPAWRSSLEASDAPYSCNCEWCAAYTDAARPATCANPSAFPVTNRDR
jgi:hypothetical protein